MSGAFRFFEKTMREALRGYAYVRARERLRVEVSEIENIAILGAAARSAMRLPKSNWVQLGESGKMAAGCKVRGPVGHGIQRACGRPGDFAPVPPRPEGIHGCHPSSYTLPPSFLKNTNTFSQPTLNAQSIFIVRNRQISDRLHYCSPPLIAIPQRHDLNAVWF